MDDPQNSDGTAAEGLAVAEPQEIDTPRHGRPFQPGRSGNPGGRPKVPDAVKQALLAALPDAVANLVAIANDPKARTADRIRANEVIIDRVMGKAAQPLVGAEGGPIQIASLVILPAPVDE